MSFLVLVMAATVAAGEVPPPAPTPTPPAAAAPSPKADKAGPDPDRVVCRNEELTGSRFTKRICLPQSEWDQMAQEADRVARQRNEHVQGGGMASGSTPP